MYADFSKLFHQSSKDLSGGGTVNIPEDDSNWPEEWKTIRYKVYPRLPKISLDDEVLSTDLFETIRKRRSRRDFSRAPISKKKLSAILKYSAGLSFDEKEKTRRMHPSGGACYPLEIYPIVFSGSDDMPPGLYHYNIRDHTLDILWQRPFTKEDVATLFTYKWAHEASCAIVITAVFYRNQMKYGERGYRYVLFEAGHIGQNVYITGGALGIKCCSIVGIRDRNVEALLDIDGFTESVLYALMLG